MSDIAERLRLWNCEYTGRPWSRSALDLLKRDLREAAKTIEYLQDQLTHQEHD